MNLLTCGLQERPLPTAVTMSFISVALLIFKCVIASSISYLNMTHSVPGSYNDLLLNSMFTSSCVL